jgi:hypothetical protein
MVPVAQSGSAEGLGRNGANLPSRIAARIVTACQSECGDCGNDSGNARRDNMSRLERRSLAGSVSGISQAPAGREYERQEEDGDH